MQGLKVEASKNLFFLKVLLFGTFWEANAVCTYPLITLANQQADICKRVQIYPVKTVLL